MTTPRPHFAQKGLFLQMVADRAGMDRADVARAFEAVAEVLGSELGEGGPGIAFISDLIEIRVVRYPATPQSYVKLAPLEGLRDVTFPRDRATAEAEDADEANDEGDGIDEGSTD